MHLGLVFLLILNSFEVSARIPITSIDYWLGNISPRCAINIMYYNLTNDFKFNSTYDIPVMFVPLKYYPFWDLQILEDHQFSKSSLRFLKARCFFSLIYYKSSSIRSDSEDDPYILDKWMTHIAYGFPYDYINPVISNVTFCLILYHGKEKTGGGLKSHVGRTLEMNAALVYLSKRSKRGYNVYCRTPSAVFKIAARNVTRKNTSIVDQKFMAACSSRYTFVLLNEHDIFAAYDPVQLESEHKIIKYMFFKANISIASRRQRERYGSQLCLPRVIVNSFTYDMPYFITFENSIRIFTCYYSPPVLSFHFYVSAFEIRVWISIIVCGVLLAAFLNFHIHFNISKTLHFSSLLFYLSIFVEETFSIPSILRNNKVYRTATILWLLTAIVLTNIYVSHVISGLNAPLKGEKLTSINDLYGNANNRKADENSYEFYGSELVENLQTKSAQVFSKRVKSVVDRILQSQGLSNGFTFLSDSVKTNYPKNVWQHIRNPFIYNEAYSNLLQIRYCNWGLIVSSSSFCRTLNKLMSPSNKYYPSGHSYERPWDHSDYPRGASEEELIQCQRSVYLERSNQLEFKYMSENYRKKRFYYLQDSFASKLFVWSFLNLQKSRIPFYFSMALQSGVYHQLHNLKLLKDHQQRKYVTTEIIRRTQKPEILDMNSSVQTIFILFSAMSLLALLAFVVELCYSLCNKWSNAFNYFKFKFRFCK